MINHHISQGSLLPKRILRLCAYSVQMSILCSLLSVLYKTSLCGNYSLVWLQLTDDKETMIYMKKNDMKKNDIYGNVNTYVV